MLIDVQPAPLGARALDLLVVLAERPGELVGKNELLDRVWRGSCERARSAGPADRSHTMPR